MKEISVVKRQLHLEDMRAEGMPSCRIVTQGHVA